MYKYTVILHGLAVYKIPQARVREGRRRSRPTSRVVLNQVGVVFLFEHTRASARSPASNLSRNVFFSV